MNLLKQDGFVKYTIENGGTIKPLIIDASETEGSGLMNPSVFIHNNKILVNVRHTNYTLYHSEKKIFPHQWGPLQYIHPEDDMTLRTNNFIAHLDDELNIIESFKVDMKLDTKPLWHFIGLEDARLFSWNDKLYLCGVRRDHLDAKGKGRMDISEIQYDGTGYHECSRTSIPAPPPNLSYCEKNWMPILDIPFHWVKWTNPTEVVEFDMNEKQTKVKVLDEKKRYNFPRDIRGGTQVVLFGDYRIALTHEVNLYNDRHGRKDGKYLHRIIVWDKDWNIVKTTSEFNFMGGEIEFATGLAINNQNALITFGFQDNAAYILSIPLDTFAKMIMEF